MCQPKGKVTKKSMKILIIALNTDSQIYKLTRVILNTVILKLLKQKDYLQVNLLFSIFLPFEILFTNWFLQSFRWDRQVLFYRTNIWAGKMLAQVLFPQIKEANSLRHWDLQKNTKLFSKRSWIQIQVWCSLDLNSWNYFSFPFFFNGHGPSTL